MKEERELAFSLLEVVMAPLLIILSVSPLSFSLSETETEKSGGLERF